MPLQVTKLISLSGLPGVGKTTIARVLASNIHATHLRIDTIEQAIRRSSNFAPKIDESGYLVAFSIAKENLINGVSVISDSVNPLMKTRDKWVSIAREANVEILEVELISTEIKIHKYRIENRRSDIENHQLPKWTDLEKLDYQTWTRERVVINTAINTPDECVKTIYEQLEF